MAGHIASPFGGLRAQTMSGQTTESGGAGGSNLLGSQLSLCLVENCIDKNQLCKFNQAKGQKELFQF